MKHKTNTQRKTKTGICYSVAGRYAWPSTKHTAAKRARIMRYLADELGGLNVADAVVILPR